MHETKTEHTLRTTAGWTLVLTMLVFLLALCVYQKLQSIPADISYPVHTALEQAGYAIKTIRIDGRDVILTGTVNFTDAGRITDIVKSVWGIREVWADLTIVSLSLPEQTLSKSKSYNTVAGKNWE